MDRLNVLVACEYSGIVRNAFTAKGHHAMSCDLLPTESPGPHYQGDIFDILFDPKWDLIIAHPPCTAICVSGNRFYAGTQARDEGIKFVEKIWFGATCPMALENPVGVLSTQSNLGKPTQYIQPWQFGHGEVKKTGLWLRYLPKLKATSLVMGRDNRIANHIPPNPNRGKLRSLTYLGIANAMANQWG